jgi:hypothetical protein
MQLNLVKLKIALVFMYACVHVIYDPSEGNKPLQPRMGREIYQY